MAYTNFRNGFSVQTASAIDRRMLLTKAEMLTAEDDYMLPDQYFCLCKDDGKFYLFDVNNEANEETGKYRRLDDTLDIKFDTEESKENFDIALQNSEELPTIIQTIVEETIRVEGGEIVDDTDNLDGGEII